MAKGFEFLEHTADLKFRAYGGSLEEALVNAARAFTEATCGESAIETKVTREVSIESPDLERLVHDWLTELIVDFSTEHMLYNSFDLKVTGKYTLAGKISGERYNPEKHKLYKEIKAATYHDMLVEGKKGRWIIEVVCDT